MPIIFWVFWLIGLVFGGIYNRDNYGTLGGFGITWLLLFLIGYQIFGSPLK